MTSTRAERRRLLKLFDKEAPALRAWYIRTNMARHSQERATAMVDHVMNRLRQGVESGEVSGRVVDGRFAMSVADLEAFSRKVKVERH